MVIKKEITDTDCYMWVKNKNINPHTNRKILSSSPIYKKFEKKCLENIKKKLSLKLSDNTDKDCYMWLKNKNINPHTNRKILSTSPIYKKFEKKCLENIKKKVSSLKLSDNTDKKKVSSLKLIDNINKNNKKLIRYFKDIKFNKNSCLELTKTPNYYLLSKNILLYKQLGKPGLYGIVYKSKNINPEYNDLPKFVSKLQLLRKESKQEVSIFKVVSNYALKNNICHFPILYASSECNKIIRDNNYPDILAKAKNNFKNYSIILYELAKGDYYSFIEKYKLELNAKIWKSIFEQFFISIFIFHYLDIAHNDTHGGNFLYTKIKPGGCFHYKINNQDYYIENVGYKWMLSDYGICTKLSKHVKHHFFDDYSKIYFHLIKYNEEMDKNPMFNKIYENTKPGYLKNDVIIPNEILSIQQKIWVHLGGLNIYYKTNYVFTDNKNEYDWFKYFIDNNILFSKYPIGPIISSSIIEKNMSDIIKFQNWK